MSLILSDILKIFEKNIPLSYQERWDNCGLQIGSKQKKIERVLFSIDICQEVLDYAVDKKFDLIVCHHPLWLQAFKNINLDSYEGRLIEKAIKNDIAIYASHTNHDASIYSMSRHYAEEMKLTDQRVLRTVEQEPVYKLVVFVPENHTQKVLDAMFNAGAGQVGAYSHCSFRALGTGTFMGDETTNPFLGKPGKFEEASENRVELLVARSNVNDVVREMIRAHPYEEVAYDLIEMKNVPSEIGLGIYGALKKPLTLKEILPLIKKVFNGAEPRVAGKLNQKIQTVAICNGSGSSLLPEVISKKIDLFITGDIKYHNAIDALRNDISLIDVGHFQSEVDAVLLLKDLFQTWFGSKLKLDAYKKLKDPFQKG